MENIENLKALGESLGYEGDVLKVFIKDQQYQLCDERLAKRDKLREKEQKKDNSNRFCIDIRALNKSHSL